MEETILSPDSLVYINWSSRENRIIKARPAIKISQWAEKRRVLSKLSEEKGPLRLSRTPYLREILDTIQLPYTETVVLVKPAQIAGTEAALCVEGYYEEEEPCPIMHVLADEDTAKHISRERIQPMFDESPALKRLKGSVWTKDEMEFIGDGYLCIGWASSVSRLASRPIKILVLDEVDKPGYYITTKEGSPIGLAIQRTETFYNRKIFMLSSPSIESGNILVEFEKCEVKKDFHVECPYCGQKQPLIWSRKYSWGFKEGRFRDINGESKRLGSVTWEGSLDATKEQIEKAGYKCGECKKLWSNSEKNAAVEKGIWVEREEYSGTPSSIGFHINRLYSLLGRSGNIPKLVKDFIDSRKSGDPKDFQNFINSALAVPWVQVLNKAESYMILKAKCALPPMVVPAEAIALTCGIDVQKYGFWFLVRAWARDYTSWMINYGRLNNWQEVDDFIFNTAYPIQGKGSSMGLWRVAIDTGGGAADVYEDSASTTEQAYWYIRQNGLGRGTRVFGTKGSSRPLATKMSVGNNIDKTPSGKPLPGGIRLVMLDTTQLKDMVVYRLNQAITHESFAAYLHSETKEDYAKQIMAEEKRLNDKGLAEWVQIKPDNHLFDCEVMAHAAADPEWIGGGVNILAKILPDGSTGRKEEPQVQPMPSDNWINRSGSPAQVGGNWFNRR